MGREKVPSPLSRRANIRASRGRVATALHPNGIRLTQDVAGSGRLTNNLDYPVGSLLHAISTMPRTTVSLVPKRKPWRHLSQN